MTVTTNMNDTWFQQLKAERETIYTVDALCGSGKTYALCDHVADSYQTKNFLYVAPTEILLKQTSAGLRDRGIDPISISTATHPGNVRRSLMESISAPLGGRVVCATFQGYIDLPYTSWLETDDWQVVIDEVPQLDTYKSFKLPRQKHLIAEHLTIVKGKSENGLVAVTAKDQHALRSQLEGELDDVEGLFRDFFITLLSVNKSTYVDLDNWNQVIVGAKAGKTDGGELRFLSVLNAKPFKQAVLMGANIADSMLARRLTHKSKCSFVPYEPIVNRLRGAHDVSSRLRISFFIPRKNVSRTKLDKITCNNTTNIQEMDLAARRAFGDEPFLYIRNGGEGKDDKHKSILDDCVGVKRIKTVSHGLNGYTDYNNIYIGGSFNRPPEQFRMLRCLGLEAEDVHRGYYHDLVYQAVMRTSLRDPNATSMVHAIVPDEPAARQLAAITGTSQVNRIEIDLNHRQPPLTQKQRQQRHAAQEELKAMYRDSERNLLDNNGDCSDSWLATESLQCPPSGRTLASLRDSDILKGADWKCCVTLHAKTNPRVSTDLRTWSGSIRDFVAKMKKFSKHIVSEKDELTLFNPSVFNLPGQATHGNFKTYEHFREAAFLVLDFDGGSLSCDDAIRIFWREAEIKRSFLIYRTFSATRENPNYFRMIFFCTKPIVSREQYSAMYQEILDQMIRTGLSPTGAKLDDQSKSPVQSWYLPGQNRDCLGLRYCEAFGVRKRELARFAMDPEECLERAPDILQFDEDHTINHRRNDFWLQESKRRLETLSGLKESRHDPIFKAVQALKFSGATDGDTRLALRKATRCDPRVVKKIEDDIRSVNNYLKRAERTSFLHVDQSPTTNCV